MDLFDASEQEVAQLRNQLSQYVNEQDWVRAWQVAQRLVLLRPRDAWGQQWLCVIALAVKQPLDALLAAQAALTLVPVCEETASAVSGIWLNLGQAHLMLGNAADAIAAFDVCLMDQPHRAAAHLGRARAWLCMGEYARAESDALEVLMVDASNVHALEVCAKASTAMGAHERSLLCWQLIESALPAVDDNACRLIFSMRQLAQWHMPKLPMTADEVVAVRRYLPDAPDLAADVQDQAPALILLAHRVRQGLTAIAPWEALALYNDPQLQLEATRLWVARHAKPLDDAPAVQTKWEDVSDFPDTIKAPLPMYFGVRDEHAERDQDVVSPTRIELAYVGGDFEQGGIAHMLEGVLAAHDRQQFKVSVLNLGIPSTECEQRVTAQGHRWLECRHLSPQQIKQWCVEHSVDVAINLNGLSPLGRPELFAARLARMQVSWLGYPGTLTKSLCDVLLADDVVMPADCGQAFDERIVFLPSGVQPPVRYLQPRLDTKRQDWGLPVKAFVLACFSETHQIAPTVWKIWMRILLSREDAVLCLLASNPEAQAALRQRAQASGVAEARLQFLPPLAYQGHLQRLSQVDIALDTFPANGITCANDAMAVGVPFVTWAGNTFASRVSASVLIRHDMAELVTRFEKTYESTLVALTTDPDLLLRIKRRLRSEVCSRSTNQMAEYVSELEYILQSL